MKSLSSILCLAPIVFGLLFVSAASMADEIRVAVASNFVSAIKILANEFEGSTEHRVILIPGSTGKHYAQIVNGAPFDLFFAADVKRPELLDTHGLIEPNSRFTYAVGKLVLWSALESAIDLEDEVIVGGDFRYLSIANPKLAPYGKAAEEVIREKGAWGAIQGKLVRGENIAQTYQFVDSGNAELGFVAYSQILKPSGVIKGSYWMVPENLYSPIEQQAVLLKNNEAARAFLVYVKSDEALEIILSFGYGTP
ncbi:MAG: molybdate ABC transporter substrate-binding protein [Gammaproteobacteria bacterium]|nr:molybdate ABC transporter substrate-binding protein [Gammaproteobacteria bacterium]